MPKPIHVLLISGSTRSGSTNTAVLRTAAAVAPDGITTTLFDGLSDLPAFNPDDDYDPPPPSRRESPQADRCRRCDLVLYP